MRATRVGACLLFLVCLLLGSGIEVKASWQQGQDSSQNDHAMSEIELLGIGEEVKEIENYLRQSLGEGQADFSFLSLMKSLLTGQFSQAAYEAGKGMKNSLLNEIEAGGGLLLQVVMIGIVGAVFSNFSSIFRGSHISETGFFVTYLLLFTCLAASFFASLQIAAKVLEQIFSFLRVLMLTLWRWHSPEEVCQQLPFMK